MRPTARTRPRRGFTIAIDGPAGSGKSTTARGCACELGFRHLDTGAMYRAMTLKVLRVGVDPADSRALGRLLRSTRVGPSWRGVEQRTMLDGEDVSRAIREPAVSGFVSEVSAVPAVRRQMVREQRRAARGHDIVCEGRDIGSVVFPDAELKIYLDCAVDARTGRRKLELAKGGRRVSVSAVRANLAKRDRIDSGRAMSPLVRVPDAVLVDTTWLTIREQVAVVCELARERMAGARSR